MSKQSRLYIIVGVLAILLMVFIDSTLPVPTDWTERYDPEGTAPFDTKVLMTELKSSKSFENVDVLYKTFYEFSNESKQNNQDYVYLILGKSIYFDQESTKELLDFVSKGNDAFIVGSVSFGAIGDTLGKEINWLYSFQSDHNLQYGFYNASQKWEVSEDRIGYDNTIASKNNESYSKLGYFVRGKQDSLYSNFIRVPYGTGNFYLLSNPYMFTNYFLLYNGTASYVNHVLSYTDKKHLIFQNYSASMRKTAGMHHKQTIDGSIFQYIFKNKPLKYAWYIIWIVVLVFIVFTAKRRQRMVPIIVPLKNTSLAFTKTISNLFYEQKDHKNIALKRIYAFMDQIRKRYWIDSSSIDEEFVQSLSMKSGVSLDLCNELIQSIRYVMQREQIRDTELLNLNRLIDQFYEQQDFKFSKN